jgi:hypothetical protein
VKASTDVISDATANSYVQREQPSPSPAATVIAASTKTGGTEGDTGSASLAIPVVVAAVVVGVMGVAAMRLKKRRDENAKLSTPVEKFGELRPTRWAGTSTTPGSSRASTWRP